jgi:uncharacterized protein (TIGR02284 family)
MEPNSQMLQVLKGLFVVCRASESGFLSAADVINTNTAREILYAYADERRAFADELGTLLRFHAGEWFAAKPAASTIIDVFSTSGKRTNQEIIRQCEKAEKAMLRVYEDALSRKCPWDVYQVLSNQYEQIKEAHYFFRVFEQIHLPLAA